MQASAITNPLADNATLLALHEAGKTQEQIAQILGGLDRSTISRRLKQLTPRNATEIFKNRRADILAEMQRKIMGRLTTTDIKSANLLQKVTATGILYDKERIERGLSDASTRPLVVIQVRGDHAQTTIQSGQVEGNKAGIDVMPVDN
jgi:hypothetical protein